MWVATMDRPAPCFHFWGMVKARIAVWFLFYRYFVFLYNWHDREGTLDKPCKVILSAVFQILLPVISFPHLAWSTQSCMNSKRIDIFIQTFWKPAFSRRRAAWRTAWNGVGEAFTKSRNLFAASGTLFLIIMVCRKRRETAIGWCLNGESLRGDASIRCMCHLGRLWTWLPLSACHQRDRRKASVGIPKFLQFLLVIGPYQIQTSPSFYNHGPKLPQARPNRGIDTHYIKHQPNWQFI